MLEEKSQTKYALQKTLSGLKSEQGRLQGEVMNCELLKEAAVKVRCVILLSFLLILLETSLALIFLSDFCRCSSALSRLEAMRRQESYQSDRVS